MQSIFLLAFSWLGLTVSVNNVRVFALKMMLVASKPSPS